MSELLPYEQELAQKLQHLPLPDSNVAWEDMKRRLKDDDDDDDIIPFWLRGCALWGLLGIFILGLGWWFFYQKKPCIRNKPIKNQSTVIKKENTYRNQVNINNTIYSVNNNITINAKQYFAKKLSTNVISVADKQLLTKENSLGKTRIKIGAHVKFNLTNIGADDETNNTNDTTVLIKNSTTISSQQSSFIKPKTPGNIDSTQNIFKDSAQKKDQSKQKKVSKEKKDSLNTKSITFSIGTAMNQQIPIDGQQLISYNSLGRKGTLADYIPSLYARIYKGNKWFIQSEFRYGAPQPTKDILYRQTIDTANPQYKNTTSTRLKKTYYHQLPVTFNYFILPNLSLGAGIIWNKFSSAVSTQDITQHNNSTGTDSVISKASFITSKKADSNFVSSYLQSVFEAQYKYRNFSFGIRYAFGIQPYLKFTLAGNTEQQEKNQSFLLFVRYELWRSKKK